ncbi:hypothetical protein TNCV_379611 [Trichonephila clavipes]|nr:hypothetical protein TNCV_379611 [Trichonephila clavipes]
MQGFDVKMGPLFQIPQIVLYPCRTTISALTHVPKGRPSRDERRFFILMHFLAQKLFGKKSHANFPSTRLQTNSDSLHMPESCVDVVFYPEFTNPSHRHQKEKCLCDDPACHEARVEKMIHTLLPPPLSPKKSPPWPFLKRCKRRAALERFGYSFAHEAIGNKTGIAYDVYTNDV